MKQATTELTPGLQVVTFLGEELINFLARINWIRNLQAEAANLNASYKIHDLWEKNVANYPFQG